VSQGLGEPSERVVIPRSGRNQPPGSFEVGKMQGDEILQVVVTVKPREAMRHAEGRIFELGRQPLSERRHLSLREYRERYAADQRDLEAVKQYARLYDIPSSSEDPELRTVVLEGTASSLSKAFSARLAVYDDGSGIWYRGRTGRLRAPRSLAKIIESVSGFDSRPRSHFKVPPKPNSDPPPNSSSPSVVARQYRFPREYDGRGQKIAIVVPGGYDSKELEKYFNRIGCRRTGKISAVSVHGSRNMPGRYREFDTELMLDLEVAGAILPGADLLVYMIPNPFKGMGGWVEAVRAAVFDTHDVSVISISWGQPEDEYSEAERTQMDQAFKAAAELGITVCCASGDWGARGGDHEPYVLYPAASPYVLACGGTMFTQDNGRVVEEVWNDHDDWASGGGLSTIYKIPSWQANALADVASINDPPTRGRGVPDVAALANANYKIQVPGGYVEAHGGTSAATPLWAALIAQLNQRLGKGRRAGYLNPLLYEIAARTEFRSTPGFNSIVKGTNAGYRAREGWDACTGLGSPVADVMLRTLAPSS
jgi:kumamolisin